MKKYVALIAIVLLAGCNTVGALPTVKNCKTVKYERNGIDIHLEADCTVPLGGPLP